MLWANVETFDVIVIGAGIAGSAAAYTLAQSKRVLLLEQHAFGHKQGSSHGGSRIFRHSYDGARYVRLAVHADEAWQALERDVGERLLFRTGGLSIGQEASTALQVNERALREAGRPYERLAAYELNRRFPAFVVPEGTHALHQPDAGILPASRCVAVLQRAAHTRGATLRDREEVMHLDLRAQHVEVRTPKGHYAADKLVVTAGPWLGLLLRDLRLPLTVEQQQILYVTVRNGRNFAPEAMPIFVNWDTGVYGFPLFDHPTAIKVSDHYGAPAIDLAERSSDLLEDRAQKTIQQVQSFMPDVSSDLVHFETCLYTKTPDEHFILDRHPHHEQVIIGGGFSGHGFKFGPTLGQILADLALEGRSPHDLSLFGLERFAALSL
jgi:sarcosine oxidase